MVALTPTCANKRYLSNIPYLPFHLQGGPLPVLSRVITITPLIRVITPSYPFIRQFITTRSPPCRTMVQWKMAPHNSSYLSNTAMFHWTMIMGGGVPIPKTNSNRTLKIGLPIKGKACLPTTIFVQGRAVGFTVCSGIKNRSTYDKLATKKLVSSGFLNQHPLEKKDSTFLLGVFWIRKNVQGCLYPWFHRMSSPNGPFFWRVSKGNPGFHGEDTYRTYIFDGFASFSISSTAKSWSFSLREVIPTTACYITVTTTSHRKRLKRLKCPTNSP